MSTLADPAAREFPFSEEQFEAIAKRARERFGLDLAPSKQSLVYSRLARRLRALKLRGFAEYLALLDGDGGEGEEIEMISALTTNVTHFFRESHHFDQLRDEVLPPLLERARKGGRVRLWSAGCSAGQEAWSMAFTVLDLCPEAPRLDLRILATDIDPAILARAEAGHYAPEEAEILPERLRSQMMEPVGADRITIKPDARALVRFGRLNLIDDWPVKGPFDTIFCRNVAIYFDKPTQERLWSRFTTILEPGGTIFIGHSERLSGPAAKQVHPTGITTYRKTLPSTESAP